MIKLKVVPRNLGIPPAFPSSEHHFNNMDLALSELRRCSPEFLNENNFLIDRNGKEVLMAMDSITKLLYMVPPPVPEPLHTPDPWTRI